MKRGILIQSDYMSTFCRHFFDTATTNVYVDIAVT
jgi:hypothetical protein